MEHAPLLPHSHEGPGDAIYQHHPVRWWLLFLLSAMSFEQVGRAHCTAL